MEVSHSIARLLCVWMEMLWPLDEGAAVPLCVCTVDQGATDGVSCRRSQATPSSGGLCPMAPIYSAGSRSGHDPTTSLQVQCCGGGVRLQGSTRGPPRVETRGFILCGHHSTAPAYGGGCKGQTSEIDNYNRVQGANKPRHSMEPHCSPIKRGHIT
jgi:hypothetical protein